MDSKRIELKENWRFHLGECEEAWYRGYDDRSWKKVMLPHDWAVEGPFEKKYSSGTGYLQGGIGWYRVRFSLPEELKGKCVRLCFDGVYKNSQVWCNSYYLGKRPNGYVPFSYDISTFVNFGKEDNEISVKVTHTDIADSRWFTGSGITRKVTLLIEEPVHPAEYGCFFTAEEVSEETAVLKVAHEITNTADEAKQVKVTTRWYELPVYGTETDEAGTVASANAVAEVEGTTVVAAGEKAELLLQTAMTNPKLWSAEQPHLYRMETWYESDGETYLVHIDKVGIRSIHFDADKGFFLNGVETKFKGVCVHHDGGCLGAAMKAEVWQRRLELLKEAGCNAIRCSHNPHMPELYELCDAMGFLMMDEAFDEWENPKNKWSTGHNVYPPKHQGYYEDFPQWHEADLKAMVLRDRNHPSVVMWSIGNEIDYPNDPYCHPSFATMTGNNDANKPAQERQYDFNKPNAERLVVLAKHLVNLVKEVDTTRPVTLAAAFPELSSHLGFLDPLDVAGYNYKEQFYEEDHKRFPHLPILGSENGHGYQAWLAVKDNPYISGQFLWTGIDYLGEAHGWPIHGSGAGIVTTCGLPKPEFYRRKTFWTEETFVRIATRRNKEGIPHWWPMSFSWNYEEGENVLIKCYAPLREGAYVALYLNGEEVRREKEYSKDGSYRFEVPYKAGTLTARFCAEDGRVLAEDCLHTTKAASELSCTLWSGADALTGEVFTEASKKTGYLYQVIVELKDEEGNRVVTADEEIRVQVFGDGELLGIDNGDLGDVTPFSSDRRKTHRGTLVAYVRRCGEDEACIQVLGVGKKIVLNT